MIFKQASSKPELKILTYEDKEELNLFGLVWKKYSCWPDPILHQNSKTQAQPSIEYF